MNKRTSLTQRRSEDQKGADVFFEPTTLPEGSPEKVKEKLVKATYYIRPEQVVALEALQLQERQRTGQRRDKSELIQEALDMLFAKYGAEQ